ncbi:23S rRNA pseudouridine1911/1915/1917 synthase [Ketogulonicigenium robustum]|uniref:Pseudouridine synthase n=1 Tax=Ketogulonicigenium robustum TaxID=92947 RepID=A0A1W6NXR5_9RHOB|nr:RluA family pseudouridine synthase [Ketogulonicigenium robustum]ARO13953.1 23S rRNA pseudouridine1911/1915/1917 synthase [Ketogulonicigenium robustum]
MDHQLLSFHIADDPPSRLDKALARDVPEEAALSRSRLAKLLDEGAVRINGVVARDAKARVAAGALVEVTVGVADESHIRGQDIPLNVVFEDDDLIVIDKPAGMVVHPAPGTPDGTVVNALIHYCGDRLSGVGGMKRPGIVHRIDKDTSGLLVAAKTDRAHHGLAALFEAHDIERHYLALTHGVPSAADPRLRGLRGVNFESGAILKIQTRLDRHRIDRQKQAVVQEGGRHAVTRVRVVESFNGAAALVDCWLETGRTHQIRVHMAYAGHGLLGDQTYGGRKKLSTKQLAPQAVEAAENFPRQALHAATLGFVHPVTGEEMRFESPLPDDMLTLVNLLRG